MKLLCIDIKGCDVPLIKDKIYNGERVNHKNYNTGYGYRIKEFRLEGNLPFFPHRFRELKSIIPKNIKIL
jgi:hypothetical protein